MGDNTLNTLAIVNSWWLVNLKRQKRPLRDHPPNLNKERSRDKEGMKQRMKKRMRKILIVKKMKILKMNMNLMKRTILNMHKVFKKSLKRILMVEDVENHVA